MQFKMCDLLEQKAEDIQKFPCRMRFTISSSSEARISRTSQCFKALPSGLQPLEWVLSCWMATEPALPRTRQSGRTTLRPVLTVPQSPQVFNKALRDPWVLSRGLISGRTFLAGMAHLPHLLLCLGSALLARIQVHPVPCGQWTNNPVVATGGNHICLHSRTWGLHLAPHHHTQRRRCRYARTAALALAPLPRRASDLAELWTMQSQWLARGAATRM